MNCPNCGRDYKDVPEGKVPGHFYRGDLHYGKNYRRFGYVCNNCGFCAEMIVKPTGLPYRKRDLYQDEDQFDIFDEVKNGHE